MTTFEALEKDIEEIKQRNKRVEIDKAWETSIARKIILILVTYISIGLYMVAIGVELPWLNAVVPSVGFFLSTLTLSFFKNFWIKKHKKS